MIGAGALAAVLETSAGGLMLASALILASAVFQLIAGIMGVKNCDKPDKGNLRRSKTKKSGSCFSYGRSPGLLQGSVQGGKIRS